MPNTQVKKAAESDFECERLWAQYAKTVIQQLEAIFFFSMYAHTHIHSYIKNYVPIFIFTYCLARACVDLWLNRH